MFRIDSQGTRGSCHSQRGRCFVVSWFQLPHNGTESQKEGPVSESLALASPSHSDTVTIPGSDCPFISTYFLPNWIHLVMARRQVHTITG